MFDMNLDKPIRPKEIRGTDLFNALMGPTIDVGRGEVDIDLDGVPFSLEFWASTTPLITSMGEGVMRIGLTVKTIGYTHTQEGYINLAFYTPRELPYGILSILFCDADDWALFGYHEYCINYLLNEDSPAAHEWWQNCGDAIFFFRQAGIDPNQRIHLRDVCYEKLMWLRKARKP